MYLSYKALIRKQAEASPSPKEMSHITRAVNRHWSEATTLSPEAIPMGAGRQPFHRCWGDVTSIKSGALIGAAEGYSPEKEEILSVHFLISEKVDIKIFSLTGE
jgi:hypothetical protein